MLISINIYWGLTQVLMKFSLDFMDYRSYVMLRYTSAAIVYFVLFSKKITRINKKTILHGSILGGLLFIQTLLNTYALKYTTAANSIFISQISIIVVPLFYLIAFKKKPNFQFVISSIFIFIGLYIFSNFLKDGFNYGDLISLVSMFILSIIIILGDKFIKNDVGIELGIIQILSAATFSLVIGTNHLSNITINLSSVLIIFLTGVIGTGVANTLRILSQKHIDPSYLILISVLHPVFTLVGSASIPNSQGLVTPVHLHQIIGTLVIVAGLLFFFYFERKQKLKRI